ncbi:efflux RND transporter periplasmic adaptor subunit [Brassicibacter mesophilus]|uniref:efflux RND transporter periplasmic adaptor subunit n=1 Tax=Brassicibacter mesophilus TaxID=745119 RepID=UPI003D1C8CC4
MAKNKKKIVAITAAVVLGIAIISVGVLKAVNKEEKPSVYVSVVNVEKEDNFDSILTTEGIIKTKDQRNIVSNLPYNIEEVLVKEGDKVSEGDILARLDTKDLEYKIKTAEINLELEKQKLKNMEDKAEAGVSTFELEKSVENAKLAYDQAQEKVKSSKQLYEAGAISKTVLEADETALITAKNGYELAQKQLNDMLENDDTESSIELQRKNVELQEINLKAQKEALEQSIIKSPMNGTIVSSNARVGITATSATPLFVMDDITNLEIEVNISEYDINSIKLGQKVDITGEAFKNKEIKGEVAYIAPAATIMNTNAGKETNVTIRINIHNVDDYLKPGFSANVSINTAHKKDALVLPYETVYENKDGTKVVFKVENNKLKEIPIEVGIMGDLKQEVISDQIKLGDKIVINPNDKMKDGMDVSILNDKGEQK